MAYPAASIQSMNTPQLHRKHARIPCHTYTSSAHRLVLARERDRFESKLFRSYVLSHFLPV